MQMIGIPNVTFRPVRLRSAIPKLKKKKKSRKHKYKAFSKSKKPMKAEKPEKPKSDLWWWQSRRIDKRLKALEGK